MHKCRYGIHERRRAAQSRSGRTQYTVLTNTGVADGTRLNALDIVVSALIVTRNQERNRDCARQTAKGGRSNVV